MSKKHFEDFRNYKKEAQELINGLDSGKLYALYEIVINKQKKSQSDERRKELVAVQEAIDNVTRLDKARLRTIREGYKSSMAQDARATDGNTRPNRKKV